MKPLFPAAALCLPALLFLSAPAFADDATDTSERRTIPELTLEERIVDLLETVQDEAPDVYRRIADLPREETLARIMRALDSGVVPASGAGNGKTTASAQNTTAQSYPVLELTEKKFSYIRFDTLTQETVVDALKTVHEKEGRTDAPGMIFDLRNTSGSDYACAETLADAARKLACPVMVLVSGGTSGSGELLAAFLRRDCGAVLLGTETAGSVFPVKRIYVDDTAWFLPLLKPEYSGISPYALKPDLEKDSEARLSCDLLKESPDKLDGDPVLRLATDLLTMRAAIKPVEQTPAL